MFDTEFNLIICKLEEKLISEREEILKKIEYYNQVDTESDELKKLKYQLALANDKIKMVKEIIDLPRYARYDAMSDTELEEYKRNRMTILNCTIDSLTYKINSEKSRILDLRMEQDDIATRYGATDKKEEKESFIKKGNNIKKTIENSNKLIQEYYKKQEEKIKERELFKGKSYDEIKDELKKSCNFNLSNLSKINISNSLIKLMASVADDYDKSMKLSNLLYEYNKCSSCTQTITIETFYTSIRNLDDSLTGGRFPRFKTNDCTRDELNEMYNYIQGLENRIEGKEAIFNRIFKKDKFLKLMDAKDKKINIDESFITYFKDELPYEQTIFNLKILVNTKENKEQELKKNRFIFNKHKIYTDISEIEKEINDLKEEIINNIIAFYMKESRKLNLGEPSFKNINSAIKYLNDCQKYFDEQKDCLNNTLKLLANYSKMLTQKEQKQNQELSDIKEKIKELSSVEFNDGDLKSQEISYIGMISKASALDHRSTLIETILLEAKDLADKKEAELKGITIDELLNQRENNGYQKKKQKDA